MTFSRDRATITAGEYGGDFPVVYECFFWDDFECQSYILGRGRTGREGETKGGRSRYKRGRSERGKLNMKIFEI